MEMMVQESIQIYLLQYLPSCLLSLPLPSFHLHIFWFKQCQGPVRLDPATLHHRLFRLKLSSPSSPSSPQRLSSQSSFSSFDSVAQGWRCSTHNMFVAPRVAAPVTAVWSKVKNVSIRNGFKLHVHPTNPSDRKAFTLCLRLTGIMVSASPSEILDSNRPNSLEPR